MTEKITYSHAESAAKEVRQYMNEAKSLRGPEYVDLTFNLSYILQEWRRPDIFDHTKDRDDFKEEYEWIHSISTFNWHMYEEGRDI